jgi:glycine cleavage system H protein
MADGGNIPQNLRYTKDHEWVRIEGDTATLGITHHAQEALGEITYVEMPPAGKTVKASEELAAVESSKAASDVFAPVGGKIAAVNEALEDSPETINASPYEDGWICRLSEIDAAEADALMTPEAYQAFLDEEDA